MVPRCHGNLLLPKHIYNMDKHVFGLEGSNDNMIYTLC